MSETVKSPITGSSNVKKIDELTEDFFVKNYQQKYLEMMRRKLGLKLEEEEDIILISNLEEMLMEVRADMTIFFRKLAQFDPKNIREFLHVLSTQAVYSPINKHLSERLENWLQLYANRLEKESWQSDDRISSMNQVNPKYILRNYMSQMAIEKAEAGEYTLLHELYELIKHPYEEQPDMEHWFALRPDWAINKIGCSMLSCSS